MTMTQQNDRDMSHTHDPPSSFHANYGGISKYTGFPIREPIKNFFLTILSLESFYPVDLTSFERISDT